MKKDLKIQTISFNVSKTMNIGNFEAIKINYGESITVDVKEWMGTNYFGAALAGAVGLFVEEATNSYVVAKLQLQEWKATAYKTLHRLIFSALYYFGGKSLFGKTAMFNSTALTQPQFRPCPGDVVEFKLLHVLVPQRLYASELRKNYYERLG